MAYTHTPVLATEVLNLLSPQSGETVLDVTLGLGGHAELLLEKLGPTGRLIALDADEENLNQAKEHLKQYADQCTFIHANFRQLPELDLPKVDILFADLGLNSAHLDDAKRGFSFRYEAPLDLRFDRSQGLTAAQWIAQTGEDELRDAFWNYGEINQAPKLARVLKEAAPQTTFDVVAVAEELFDFRAKSLLPQIFQALRIAVNDELGSLEVLLENGPVLLKPNGRMGIISFHSLEDRLVKNRFKELTTPEKDDFTGAVSREADFALLTKKPIVPGEEEVERNPRARSGKFRAVLRV